MRIDVVLNHVADTVYQTARRSCWPRGVKLVINRGHDDVRLLIFNDNLGNVRVPWAATTEDLCADDWEVA